MRDLINLVTEGRETVMEVETPRPTSITITLSKSEAEVVSEALNHVWRNVFDRERQGNGLVLRKLLDQLNKITDSRR